MGIISAIYSFEETDKMKMRKGRGALLSSMCFPPSHPLRPTYVPQYHSFSFSTLFRYKPFHSIVRSFSSVPFSFHSRPYTTSFRLFSIFLLTSFHAPQLYTFTLIFLPPPPPIYFALSSLWPSPLYPSSLSLSVRQFSSPLKYRSSSPSCLHFRLILTSS